MGGLAALSDLGIRPVRAEPAPETTRIRLPKASLCTSPVYIAEELLRAETRKRELKLRKAERQISQ